MQQLTALLLEIHDRKTQQEKLASDLLSKTCEVLSTLKEKALCGHYNITTCEVVHIIDIELK